MYVCIGTVNISEIKIVVEIPMSLLFTSKDGWIISHLQYVNEMYGEVVKDDRLCALSFNKLIFEINSQYLRQNQVAQTIQDSNILHGKRKRKRLQLLPQKDLENVGLKSLLYSIYD